MSVKMIGFAIIGLVSIILVNFMFYRELKKTFKERKLIWFDVNEEIKIDKGIKINKINKINLLNIFLLSF
jgi:hypothetical protein